MHPSRLACFCYLTHMYRITHSLTHTHTLSLSLSHSHTQAFVLGVLEAAQTSPQLLGPTVMHFLDAEAVDLRMEAVVSQSEGEGSEEEDDDEEGEESGK